jgi:hypothetical protein
MFIFLLHAFKQKVQLTIFNFITFSNFRFKGKQLMYDNYVTKPRKTKEHLSPSSSSENLYRSLRSFFITILSLLSCEREFEGCEDT